MASLQQQLEDSQQQHAQALHAARQGLIAEHAQALERMQQQHHQAELQAHKAASPISESRLQQPDPPEGYEESGQNLAGKAPSVAVEDLLEEVERLRREKGDAEAQADELAASLVAERQRSGQQVRMHWCIIDWPGRRSFSQVSKSAVCAQVLDTPGWASSRLLKYQLPQFGLQRHCDVSTACDGRCCGACRRDPVQEGW